MPNRELNSAVEFICRNSVRSTGRTDLIEQVVRTFLLRRHEHLRKDVRDQKIRDDSRPILSQFHARGFI